MGMEKLNDRKFCKTIGISIMNNKPRVLAIYLPQYHPIKENDQWWGTGYTEWVAVAAAKPLYQGHEQPIIPGELGFYDLRFSLIQEQQAALAKQYGIEGFVYWHYWLGDGKRLLEKPAELMLHNPKVDIPFCFAWANHSWKGVFFGAKGHTLVQQLYNGIDDYRQHFEAVLPYFRDKRYIRVNGKPLFGIFNPAEIPSCKDFTEYWNSWAKEEGLGGITFYGELYGDTTEQYGLDFSTFSRHRVIEHIDSKAGTVRYLERLRHHIPCRIKAYPYKDAMPYFLKDTLRDNEWPSIITGWDTTARLGKEAVVLYDRTPELFREHVKQVLTQIKDRSQETNIVFIKSWNEWAEGNYLEPDRKWGRAYLEVLKNELDLFL